jgi:hypothetical protein
MVPVEGAREDLYPIVEAVGVWESRRGFQRVWEGWEAGFMAFHAFSPVKFDIAALPKAHLSFIPTSPHCSKFSSRGNRYLLGKVSAIFTFPQMYKLGH